MKIRFFVPATMVVVPNVSGVVAQMRAYRQALEAVGCEVVYFSDLLAVTDHPPPDWFFVFQHHLSVHELVYRLRKFYPESKLAYLPIYDAPVKASLIRQALFNFWPRQKYLVTSPAMLRHAMDFVDLVFARSDWERDRLVETGTSTPISICEICSPKAQVESRLPIEASDREGLLFVGNAANPRKNVGRLMTAAMNLDLSLDVVGVEPDPMQVETLKRKFGLRFSNNIRILGVLSDSKIAEIMAQRKVICLPSLYEGVGLAALEGFAAGMTPFVTSVGGAPYYFRDNAVYCDHPREIGHVTSRLEAAYRQDFDADSQRATLAELSLENIGSKLVTAIQ